MTKKSASESAAAARAAARAGHETLCDTAGRNVRLLRLRRGWSVRELAAACAATGSPLSPSALYNIESRRPHGRGGPRQISLDELSVLAYSLGVAPVHLILGVDDKRETWVTPDNAVSADLARAWWRGQDVLPSVSRQIFASFVPDREWPAVAAALAGEDCYTADGKRKG